jgi:hypothetical protein
MSRIRLAAFSLLLGRRRREPPRRRLPEPEWFDPPSAALPDEAPPLGSGWFESSADLRRGLAVHEASCDDWPGDARTTAWSAA